ncbi:flagellar hook-associated protein 2 [Halobacillus massiliensis]|uniref:flagellar hook-associated protein 2 n=1 Tax=Halobacillus massiliensis TaxID=1926286 RepID=UPI0009E21CC9|nr:flagellar hook-associated protein 2 [Halobacillus massiliensis]
MRIGGLASGMDIDGIVADLMQAERRPLNKLEQTKTRLEWQRDAYRDVNKQFLELDQLALEMKLDRTFQGKDAVSSSSNVEARATSGAGEGTYKLEVKQIAESAYNYSERMISASVADKLDPSASLASQRDKFGTWVNEGSFTITTADGEMTFEIDEEESLNKLLQDISSSDLGIRAFYDQSADKVMFERTKTGNFVVDGNEIQFSGEGSVFLTETLGLNPAAEVGGKDARFTYNNALEITSYKNTYSLNGVNFNLKEKGTATITVTNNVDEAVEKITGFVEKYNSIIESLTEKLNERKNREYPPLTDDQKKAMEEDEIEKWEEQARKGLLYGDTVLSNALTQMRTSWYSKVNTGSELIILSDIGISTSSNYLARGKLEINKDELRTALSENAESVKALFANSGEADNKGIIRHLEDTIDYTRQSIERKAGKESSTSETFTLGRELKDMDNRIQRFEDKMVELEDRYWKQFGAMEKAIQEMNSQSSFLQQNFFNHMM